jgi:GxxExxY protein
MFVVYIAGRTVISMDRQDEPGKHLQHAEITREIIGCAFEVINELGAGFLESVYENAMLVALQQRGLAAQAQYPITVAFRGQCVGEFYADILVAGKVIVELKAVKAIAPEHRAQTINYLNATGVEVGLLINFGNPRLEWHRFTRTTKTNIDTQD